MVNHNFGKYDLSDRQAETLTAHSECVFDAVDDRLASIPTTDVTVDDIESDVDTLLEEFIPTVGMHQYTRHYIEMLGAGVVIRLRELDVPLRIGELACIIRDETGYSEVDLGEISRWKRKIDAHRGSLSTPADTDVFISRYASELGVAASETADIAQSIVTELGDQSGKSPGVVAGSVLWVASQQTDDHVLQKEIAELAGVSPMSLRKNADQMDGVLASVV